MSVVTDSTRMIVVPAATEEGAAFRANKWLRETDFRSITIHGIRSCRPIMNAGGRFEGEWLVKVAVTEQERKP